MSDQTGWNDRDTVDAYNAYARELWKQMTKKGIEK